MYTLHSKRQEIVCFGKTGWFGEMQEGQVGLCCCQCCSHCCSLVSSSCPVCSRVRVAVW